GANGSRGGLAVARRSRCSQETGIREFRRDHRIRYVVRPALHQCAPDANQLTRRISYAVPVLPGAAAVARMLPGAFVRSAGASRSGRGGLGAIRGDDKAEYGPDAVAWSLRR